MKATRRGGQPERSVLIADALSALLDDIEGYCEQDWVAVPADPIPLSCGITTLDRAFGGGVHIGTLTLIEADLSAQARAVILSIARHIDHPALLAVASTKRATEWLFAGASGVPATLINDCLLDEGDWSRLSATASVLGSRPLNLTESASVTALGHLIVDSGAPILLVEELSRLGPPCETLAALVRLAAVVGVAVVATSEPLGDLPSWATESVNRVTMVAHGLGARAALISGAAFGDFVVEQIRVDCLEGAIR